jgi:FMN phosphatase YigB (HAD superfamily)
MHQAVTFDFHNTLVRCDAWFDLEVRELPEAVGRALGLDENPLVTNQYREVRAEIIGHGLEMDATQGVIEAWRRVGTDLDPESISPVIDSMMADLVPASTLLEGAHEAVRTVHRAGFPLGVISSAVHHQFIEWALEFHGIRDLFTEVVTSAQVGFYKSRTEIYEIAYARLGVAPDRSVHIGDSYRFDHLTGRKAGLATVWLNAEKRDLPLEGPAPSSQVHNMSQASTVILDLLANLRHPGGNSHAD